jgi:hypothetical protein
MLVYKLLGDDAQQQFARPWGVSYRMGAGAHDVACMSDDAMRALVPR